MLAQLLTGQNGYSEHALPDKSITPCLADPALTKEKLCAKHFTTKEDRNVDEATKEKVCQEYGLPPDCNSKKSQSGQHEIDHCIAITDGGAEDIKNLWPQSYGSTPWNAHLKDKLEVHLHSLMCKGTITLKDAQDTLSGDWREGYKKYFGEPK